MTSPTAFGEIPLLLLVFEIDDHGGANIDPAIWWIRLVLAAIRARCCSG
jgi:hypothetical protein